LELRLQLARLPLSPSFVTRAVSATAKLLAIVVELQMETQHGELLKPPVTDIKHVVVDRRRHSWRSWRAPEC